MNTTNEDKIYTVLWTTGGCPSDLECKFCGSFTSEDLARKRVNELCLRENDQIEHFVVIASEPNQSTVIDSFVCPDFDILQDDKKKIQEERSHYNC
jgi:hypothetical protein